MLTIETFSKQLKLTLLTIGALSMSGCQLYGTKSALQAEERTPNSAERNATLHDDPSVLKHRELAEKLLTYRQKTMATEIKYCQYFPMGYSACGGPAQFIVYSTQGMSESDLQQLTQTINEFNQLDALQKSLKTIHSHCSALPTPQIILDDGHCRAKRTTTTIDNRL